MIKYFCDRCGKEIDKSYRTISYSGNEEADLCIECFDEFLNWMENKPVEDKPIEIYERVDWDGKVHTMLL